MPRKRKPKGTPGQKAIVTDRNARHPSSRKRTDAEIERDKADISRMLLAGWSLREMAEWVAKNRPYTLHITTIQDDVHRVMQDWHDEINKNRGLYVARMFAQYAHITKLAEDSFEKSKDAKRRTTTKSSAEGSGGKAKPIEASITTEDAGAGDPAFLNVMLQAANKVCDLMGLEPAKRVQHNLGDSADDVPTAKALAAPDETEAKERVEIVVYIPDNGRLNPVTADITTKVTPVKTTKQ